MVNNGLETISCDEIGGRLSSANAQRILNVPFERFLEVVQNWIRIAPHHAD
jgi:hypothetical protein